MDTYMYARCNNENYKKKQRVKRIEIVILFARFQKTNFANYCFFLLFFMKAKILIFFYFIIFIS